MVLPSFFLGTKEIPWCDAWEWSSMVVFVLIVKVCSRVYATLYRLAFAEVPDAETGQIEAL
jgi:hypothetical protein